MVSSALSGNRPGPDCRDDREPPVRIAVESLHEPSRCAEWIEQPEDVLSYALFGQVAVKFFEYRRAQKYKIDADLVDMENKTYPV